MVSRTTHALTGVLDKVADDGKSFTVKMADGTEQVFKVSGKTVYGSAETGAREAALKGREGSHVVVHYTTRGAEKTAREVKVVSEGSWKATQGTVTKMDQGAKDVTVKLDDGSEKTFHLGKEAAVETAHGAVDASQYTAKEGDKVVVYSSEKAGKEVVHLFQKL